MPNFINYELLYYIYSLHMINFIDVFCKDYTHYSQISFKCREIKENKSQQKAKAKARCTQ